MENNIILQGLSKDELLSMIRDTLREELNSFPQTHEEKLYTRTETAKRLKITLPTLNEYTKRGIIQASRIGSRILYTESSVSDAIKNIPKSKNY